MLFPVEDPISPPSAACSFCKELRLHILFLVQFGMFIGVIHIQFSFGHSWWEDFKGVFLMFLEDTPL